MQELNMVEVDDVSGGNPIVIGVIVVVCVAAFAIGVYNGYKSAEADAK